VKLYMGDFYYILWMRVKLGYNRVKITDVLQEDLLLHYFLAACEISWRTTMSRRLRYKYKKYRRVGEAEETVESHNIMWRHLEAG
jgi:hypothetical protein